MCEQKISQKIGLKPQIPVNLATNTKRTVYLIELAVYCPKCGTKEIIERKKAGNWKLGVCNRCNVRTWLKTIAIVKRFGNKRQYVKLRYLQRPFESFWQNIGEISKQTPKKAFRLKYEPLSKAKLKTRNNNICDV